MNLRFPSRQLTTRTIRINGKIKKAIEKYNYWKVPMKVLLTNFLAVKSKGDELAKAENPWEYFYKGINGHEVESGVSVDETLFRFSTMEIKNQKPTDVINAAFFANKKRNDFEFEIGYLLPVFLEILDENSDILIVNPSPDMICEIETLNLLGKHFYAVVDQTIAELYKIQFPEADFIPFDQIEKINNVDAVLIMNRDQKAENTCLLLKSIYCCKSNAAVVAFVPSAWFDNPQCGAYKMIEDAGLSVKQILIVDTKATVSTPRKKILTFLDNSNNSTIQVKKSSYDIKTKMFTVLEDVVFIKAKDYLKSQKTILSFWNDYMKPVEPEDKPKYQKAEEYIFSKEISVFFKLYSDRKNRYAGLVYYKEIKDINLKTWGRKLSADIEKGLRANSKEKVVSAIENTVFDDAIYSIIRTDIEKKYVMTKKVISLKTIWFYCWIFLVDLKKYDHLFLCQLFEIKIIADYVPGIQTGEELIELIAKGLDVEIETISYKVIEQINMILNIAAKHRVIVYNPLEPFVAAYTSRATERQQDVRNALVKKHFTEAEEIAIFKALIENENMDGRQVCRCVGKSLLLATAIRMFTGMAIREVAALTWNDYKCIEGTDAHQFAITKFVDSKGKVILHSERENWKRFRLVPVAGTLSCLLDLRRQYLIELGINEEYLGGCPIILQEEKLTDMKQMKKMNHCKPEKISKSGNYFINLANISENELVLPDDRNDLASDFNRYHGDIFLSNFRHKANHMAYMTVGEINYMIGINAPDTFSRHYCDYTNDFLQIGIIQKLRRWELYYERMIKRIRLFKPAFGETEGNLILEFGPYETGIAAVDLIIENNSDSELKISAKCKHGIEVNKTTY